MDTADLRRAYADFLSAARNGRFAQPHSPNSWSADMVLAHLIVSDREIAAAVARAMAGNPPAFDNSASQAEPLLKAVVQAAGSWPRLLDALEQAGNELVAVAAQLTDEQAAIPIPIKVVSDGHVVIDATAPLASLVRVPTTNHLRMHLDQLTSLAESRVETGASA